MFVTAVIVVVAAVIAFHFCVVRCGWCVQKEEAFALRAAKQQLQEKQQQRERHDLEFRQ
jgi:hypothetical protein